MYDYSRVPLFLDRIDQNYVPVVVIGIKHGNKYLRFSRIHRFNLTYFYLYDILSSFVFSLCHEIKLSLNKLVLLYILTL